MSGLTKQEIETLEIEAYEAAIELQNKIHSKVKIDINNFWFGANWILEKLANGVNAEEKQCNLNVVNNLAKLAEFVKQQKDLPPEINDIVNDNFWDLI